MEAELKRRRTDARRRGTDADTPEFVVSELLRRARYGSYFDCLGLPVDAGTTDVREAWLKLSAMLSDLKTAATGNPELLQAMDQVEKVAADGFEVLSDPDLRLAYVRALEK